MKNFFKILNATVAVSALVATSILPGEALAATQGTLGATSTGSIGISVNKPIMAQISGLVDLSVPSFTAGMGAQDLSENVCVYSDTPSGGYKITATSTNGTAGAFAMINGANNLAYTVNWNAGGVGALGAQGSVLTSGTQSGSLSHASTTSATCSNNASPTARLDVNITQGSLDAAVEGVYTDTLTLLITPV